MTASSSFSATSVCWASIAALARVINSAVVSLGVCSQMAQIRASTCLALASSGAAFSAPNRKSSPRVLSAPAFGQFLLLPGPCPQILRQRRNRRHRGNRRGEHQHPAARGGEESQGHERK